MSRTNVYILIATALLGVLLIIIVRIVDELPSTQIADAGIGATTRLDYPRLLMLLDASGVDGEAAVTVARRWLQERGFLGANEPLGIGAADAPVFYYESLDSQTLESMAQNDDMGALQTLAARSLVVDPFAATDLYTRAAAVGSEFAMLQLGSLFESFSSIAAANVTVDPEYARNLRRLRASRHDRDLREDALAFALAAIRGGDLPIVQPEILDWVNRMADELEPQQLSDACQRSARIFFEMSAVRRSRGQLRLSPRPPPVFITVPDLGANLPCGRTPSPVDPVLDTSGCRVQLVQDRSRELELYICP